MLVVRVHNLVPKEEWQSRYERINLFEKMLHRGRHDDRQGVPAHQQGRAAAAAAIAAGRSRRSGGSSAGPTSQERRYWDDYQRAYEAAMTRCNTEHAPWYIVPANRKWYRNLVVSRILRKTLEKMAPQYPPAEEGLDGMVVE